MNPPESDQEARWSRRVALVMSLDFDFNRRVRIKHQAFLFTAFSLSLFAVAKSQTEMSKDARAKIIFISAGFAIGELEDLAWKKAKPVKIGTYWSGDPAAKARHFEARMLWSNEHLYVRFEASQSEPLIVSEKVNLEAKTRGLWDRDVAEIFIAPDKSEPRKYFEFEIAPNGEWIDLGIDLTSGERVTDWDYKSGMESASRVEKGRVLMAIKIPWKSLGRTPKAGDVWLGNLYRCVGEDPTRGYLAWRPTMTKEPAFHVPERFGEFKFVR